MGSTLRRTKTLEDRFWSHVDKTSSEKGCWLWTASQNKQGYGQLKNDAGSALAHRISYALVVGSYDFPDLDHTCHVTYCVNPEHLRPVTHKQNMEHLTKAKVTSKTGILGVTWEARVQRYRVRVTHNRKQYDGGYHTDAKVAESKAKQLRNSLFTHNDSDRQ